MLHVLLFVIYLPSQLWDRDILKYNDHIAEAQLDLGPAFTEAYKNRDRVILFQNLEAKKKEAMRKLDVSTHSFARLSIPGSYFFTC